MIARYIIVWERNLGDEDWQHGHHGDGHGAAQQLAMELQIASEAVGMPGQFRVTAREVWPAPFLPYGPLLHDIAGDYEDDPVTCGTCNGTGLVVVPTNLPDVTDVAPCPFMSHPGHTITAGNREDEA